jgi:hypothetical protein
MTPAVASHVSNLMANTMATDDATDSTVTILIIDSYADLLDDVVYRLDKIRPLKPSSARELFIAPYTIADQRMTYAWNKHPKIK